MPRLPHFLLALWASLCVFLYIPIAQADDKVPVVASFSILGDIVQAVGGEHVAVTLLAGVNTDAHGFEPQPRHARALVLSKLLVLHGLGFDPWAQRLAQSTRYAGTVVVASDGITPRKAPARSHGSSSHDHDHDHEAHGHAHAGASDPHAWQDPLNARVYARNIATALQRVDPAHSADYERNAAAYIRELEALDAWIRNRLAAIPPAQRTIVTNHDAFGYFGDRYQLRLLAPLGLSTNAQASAKQVAALVQQIRREKVRALFLENLDDARLLRQVASETGLKPGGTLYSDALSPAGTPGATYLGMLRHNAEQMAQGLQAH